MVITPLFMLGVFFCVFAVVLLFMLGLQFYGTRIDPFGIIILTFVEGLVVLALGYGSVIILGGVISLRLIEFMAYVTNSRHVIEVIHEDPRKIGDQIIRQNFLAYLPALIFALAVSLAWDIHNLSDPRTSVLYPVLCALDVFSKPYSVDPILLCVDVIPAMVVLVFIAGLVPSIVLPYFRRFKITGVNSRPFHTSLLFTVVGFIAGLSALLTLVGFVYEVLWVGRGPYYYHYVLVAMLGFSFHYTVGAFLARDKSEDMVITKLKEGADKRVSMGTVNIQGP